MRTLSEWLDYLGWDTAKLAAEAGIAYNTARKAVDGEPVTARVARLIAAAISTANNTMVQPGDIRELKIY